MKRKERAPLLPEETPPQAIPQPEAIPPQVQQIMTDRGISREEAETFIPEKQSEKVSPGLFSASEPPHSGMIDSPAPESEGEVVKSGKRGRPPGKGKKKLAAVVSILDAEPTRDDVQDVRFVLDMVLFAPAEKMLGFEAPEDESVMRMSRIGAKIWLKHFAKETSDEYKFAGLLFMWILVNAVQKWGKRGQPANRSVRTEAAGQNPLDAPLSPPAH